LEFKPLYRKIDVLNARGSHLQLPVLLASAGVSYIEMKLNLARNTTNHICWVLRLSFFQDRRVLNRNHHAMLFTLRKY